MPQGAKGRTMHTIQQSHDRSDWRYMPNTPFIKYNELPKDHAHKNVKWLRDNNHSGTFYRVVETITDAEIQGFIERLLDDSYDDSDDSDHFEIITSGDDLKISELITSEAKDYFGQTITLDQFIMIREGLLQGAKG